MNRKPEPAVGQFGGQPQNTAGQLGGQLGALTGQVELKAKMPPSLYCMPYSSLHRLILRGVLQRPRRAEMFVALLLRMMPSISTRGLMLQHQRF